MDINYWLKDILRTIIEFILYTIILLVFLSPVFLLVTILD